MIYSWLSPFTEPELLVYRTRIAGLQDQNCWCVFKYFACMRNPLLSCLFIGKENPLKDKFYVLKLQKFQRRILLMPEPLRQFYFSTASELGAAFNFSAAI